MKACQSMTCFLAGWLLVSALFHDHGESALPSRIEASTPHEELLRRGAVRELRALGGLGPKRAQAIVYARVQNGALPPLQEIPGIGPATAARIRSALSPNSGALSSSRSIRERLTPADRVHGAP